MKKEAVASGIAADVTGETVALASCAPTSGYGAPAEVVKCKGAVRSAKDDDLCPCADRHYPFLDITRICCVALVALDHGAPEYGRWNVLFTQAWVLQYLYLVCGVCFGMSHKPLWEYELRLCLYCVVGIGINWSAWVVKGLDWRSNFFAVVYHFWFIVGMIVFTLLLAPIRAHFERTRWDLVAASRPPPEGGPELPASAATAGLVEDVEVAPEGSARCSLGVCAEAASEDRSTVLMVLGVVGGGWVAFTVVGRVVMQPLLKTLAPEVVRMVHSLGTGTVFWGLPQVEQDALDFLTRLSCYTTLSLTNIYFIFVCPRVLQHRELITWFIFVNTYCHRCLWFRDQDERPWHGFDLVTLGLTVQCCGLLWRRKLGEYMVRYWFIIILTCTLLWPLGLHDRLDEHPQSDWVLRIRANAIEAIFVLVWFCAGDRFVSRQIFTEDRLQFLNTWALLIFLVHKAVHILLPSPWNWIMLGAIAPVCYLSQGRA